MGGLASQNSTKVAGRMRERNWGGRRVQGSVVPWEGWGDVGPYRGMLSPAPFPFAGEDLVSEQALQIQEAAETGQ